MDPFVDFSFKRLFGTESNKDVLMSFLNALLKEHKHIVDVSYRNTERLGHTAQSRKVVFDLYCETETGERIIIELQNAGQRWFKHRSLFYATVAINEQEVRGEWDYYLDPVYVICLMNFCFDDTQNNVMVHNIGLINKATCEVFNGRLQFIYIEMPKFHKKESDLQEEIDYWFYIFRNLATLERIPVAF